MKKLLEIVLLAVFFATAVRPAAAAYTSLYVFGDGLSTTTDNPQSGPLYYGKRYSNGRVWVEVLAQRQGLAYEAGHNNSYFDHNSTVTAADVRKFTAPPDVATSLFVVWVGNADTFDAASVPDNAAQWQAANNQSQVNHLEIITNLYAKGVRTLILPNAVDISQIPAFNAGTLIGVMHDGCVDFNTKFATTVNQARTLCPELQIFTPDTYRLFENMLTNAAYYGLTNVTVNGKSIAAIDAANYGFPAAKTNGYGTNYIFWDPQDPTAKLHAVLADIFQQIISPVQIGRMVALTGSNRLDVVNVPIGLNGFVEGITNLTSASWATAANITSSNAVQSVFVPVAGPQQFYRLRFPYYWSWP